MGFNIELKRIGRHKEAKIKAEIKNPKTYLDWICEIAEFEMTPKDTLTISWDVSVFYIITDDLTGSASSDTKQIYVKEKFVPKENMIVRYARLVHFKNKSKIYVYEKLPELSFPDEDKKW